MSKVAIAELADAGTVGSEAGIDRTGIETGVCSLWIAKSTVAGRSLRLEVEVLAQDSM
jgi:hypothetical protein